MGVWRALRGKAKGFVGRQARVKLTPGQLSMGVSPQNLGFVSCLPCPHARTHPPPIREIGPKRPFLGECGPKRTKQAFREIFVHWGTELYSIALV